MPFFFPESVAPLISARQHQRPIPLEAVIRHIHTAAEQWFSQNLQNQVFN